MTCRLQSGRLDGSERVANPPSGRLFLEVLVAMTTVNLSSSDGRFDVSVAADDAELIASMLMLLELPAQTTASVSRLYPYQLPLSMPTYEPVRRAS